MNQTREAKRKYLRSYQSAVLQMNQAKNRLDELRDFAGNITICISGIPGVKGPSTSKVERAVELLEEAQERYLEQFAEALQIREDVEMAIMQLEKQIYRDVLRHRYIQGLTVIQIAETMKFDERWIRRLINQAIDQLNLPNAEAGEGEIC